MLQQRSDFGLRYVVGLVAAVGLVLSGPVSLAAQQPLVDKVVLDETIQPVSAGLLERAIARANTDGAAALLVQMDTPGGLVESMRSMAGSSTGPP